MEFLDSLYILYSTWSNKHFSLLFSIFNCIRVNCEEILKLSFNTLKHSLKLILTVVLSYSSSIGLIIKEYPSPLTIYDCPKSIY